MAEWFAPKRYGIGAGRPVSWQGWLLTIGVIVLVAVASLLIRYSWIAFASAILTLMLSFTIIAARTTRGGWRWRWGEED